MNEKSSSSPPPSEQSGYFILDVRELDSFIAGPWLEIIPRLNSSSNNKLPQEQEQQEDDDCNKISKATASSSSSTTTLSKSQNNKTRRAKLCYIPMSELKSRLFELPAKRSNLILVYDSDQDSDYIQQHILGDGWTIVDEFRMVGARNTETMTSSHRQSYIESASWLVSPEVFGDDKNKTSSSTAPIKNSNIKFPLFHNTPFTMDEIRGWSPSPFLEKHFDSVIYPSLLRSSASLKGSTTKSDNISKSTGGQSSSSLPFYSALDIGSGNGRDIAYIASRGIFDTIFAIDNRHHLLENCVSLTKRYSIATRNSQPISAPTYASSSSMNASTTTTCHGICCSVSSTLPLREESFDLIICVRFLERSLLTSLARHLTVGGFLLYSHFVDGVQHSAVGQPKNPKAYVMHGELKKKIVDEAILPSSLSAIARVREDNEDDNDNDDNTDSTSTASSASWKIKVLVDEEVLLEDGRPVNNLLIQRIG